MSDSANPLAHQVALVTGASSGIGRALCERMSTAGALVYGISRSPEDVPSSVQHIPCDLREPEEIDDAIAELTHLDIVVNNAGIAYKSGIIDGDPSDWDAMLQLNVRAVALLCQKTLPLLGRHGRILNVSSQSGHRVPPSGGFYAATKFAVRGITDALRYELAGDDRNIRVGTISPGFVDTALLDIYFKGREEALAETRTSAAMLTADDVADTIFYMLTSPPSVAFDDIRMRAVGQLG